MKKIIIGLATVLAGGIVLGLMVRRCRTEKIAAEVSDEGYETAHDILYPRSSQGSKLRYGPVLPS
ncbi:MAG: hypothetical protein EOP54_29035 [Sphingobacteriales bacterium]|nr:MAG: hypothetical protein EOP54_29035 [Sphingobacteriales bacterium]